MADEAAAVLVSIGQAFSSQWDADTWRTVMSGPFSYLFELPKSHFAADEDAAAVVSCLKHQVMRKWKWETTDVQTFKTFHGALG